MTAGRLLVVAALFAPAVAYAQLPGGGGGPLGEEEHIERDNEPSTLTPDLDGWAPPAGHKLPRNGLVFLESRLPLSAEWATEKGVFPAVLQRLVPGCFACIYAVELPDIEAGDATLDEVTLRVVGPRQETTLSWPVEDEDDLEAPEVSAGEVETETTTVRDTFGFLITQSATFTVPIRPGDNDDVAAFVVLNPDNLRPLGAALRVGGCDPCVVSVVGVPVEDGGVCAAATALDHAGNRGLAPSPQFGGAACVGIEPAPLWAFPSCGSVGPHVAPWALVALLGFVRRSRPRAA